MDTLGDRVRKEREGKDWSQQRLADEVGRRGYKIRQSAIGNIESRGDTEPKCIVQLAAALGVSVTWLQTGKGDKQPPQPVRTKRREGDEEPETPIAHYVGAGDEVHLVDDAGTDTRIDMAPAPPGFDGQHGAAAVVRGDSMKPLFDPGDLLYFRTRLPPPSSKGLPARPVIVQVKGGRLYVKKLLPGTKKGAYHLLSVNPLTPPLQDQMVDSFAHIEWVKPRLG